MENLPKFGKHRCEVCSCKGHCSIETAARYFGAHPEEEREMREVASKLGSWYATLVMDALESDKPSEFIFTISFGLGWALAKGAELAPCEPDETQGLDAILKASSDSRPKPERN